MDNDPFSPQDFQGDSAPDAFDNRPIADATKNYLEELVGEGKKFKSVDDLARGKYEADQYVSTLLREIKEVKEELNKRMTVEDLMTRLKKDGSQTPMTTNNPVFNTSNHSDEDHGQGTGTNSNLDLEAIKKALKEELAQEQEKARRNQNLQDTVKKLQANFGDNTSAVLNQKAQELGVNVQYLRELAEDKPSLLFKLIGEGNAPAQRRNDVFSPPSGVNTAGMNRPQAYGEHKPRSYYEKLKATDPKKYFSAQTSVQMHKDALALGTDFFDT